MQNWYFKKEKKLKSYLWSPGELFRKHFVLGKRFISQFMYLFERFIQQERQVFHLLVHSPQGCVGQSLAVPKAGARGCFLCSHGCRGPMRLAHFPLLFSSRRQRAGLDMEQPEHKPIGVASVAGGAFPHHTTASAPGAILKSIANWVLETEVRTANTNNKFSKNRSHPM